MALYGRALMSSLVGQFVRFSCLLAVRRDLLLTDVAFLCLSRTSCVSRERLLSVVSFIRLLRAYSVCCEL